MLQRLNKKQTTILAIETSCDETAAAVLRGQLTSKKPHFKLLSSVINSQIKLHIATGGIVPEVAARAHIKNILPVTKLALKKAELSLEEIDYLAVTSGPGLIVSLIVGVEFIKGLSLATGKPILPTNHMAGHLYSAFVKDPSAVKFPVIALVVSGGHTLIIHMESYSKFKVIGSTVDDAAGEAFDKVARLLGLPYPGGPEISKLAKLGKPTVSFPRPMLHEKNYSFSFSGLKTAVRYHIESLNKKLTNQDRANIASSFEQAAVDVLVKKTFKAAQNYKAKTIALSGGVAANQALRNKLLKISKQNKLNFIVPEYALCTDNAAMIAAAAYFNLKAGHKPVNLSKVKADPNWEL